MVALSRDLVSQYALALHPPLFPCRPAMLLGNRPAVLASNYAISPALLRIHVLT